MANISGRNGMVSGSGWSEFRAGGQPLLGAFLGTGVGVAALYFYSMGTFIKPLQQEFGWSRGAVSVASLVASLVVAVTSPAVGKAVDRIGPRWVAGLSLAGLAFGFLLLSLTTGNFSIFLAVVALTCLLGSGSSAVVFTRVVTSWFVLRRGTALGILMASIGVCGAVAPRVLVPFIALHGWRAGYRLLALVIVVATPVIVLLISQRDTASDAPAPGARAVDSVAPRRIFVILGFAFFFAALGIGGIIVHFVPMLTDAGLSPAAAGATAGAIGIAIIFGRLVAGALVDYVFAPYVAGTLLGLAGIGCILLAAGGVAMALPAALLVGLAMGAEIDMIGYLVARYYGLRRFGRVFGWQYAIFLSGAALSPVMIGILFDRLHTYQVALYVAGGCLLLAALLTQLLPQFPKD